jgi:glycosyltransferase involved in cell wall biosynthesis
MSQPLPHRILYVEANEDGTVGGSHQALGDLVGQLSRTLYQPVILFYQDNRFARALREGGEEVHVWEDVRAGERAVHMSGRRLAKLREIVAAIVRRRDFLRRERIALVHINNSPRVGRTDWLPAARTLRIPIIASAMGDAEPIPGSGWRVAVHRWLFRRFDFVLAISEYMADAMRRQGIPDRRLQVVHLGVDDLAIRARVMRSADEVRRELGVPAGRVFVAMVANVREWKGQHVGLEALRRMAPATRGRLFVAFVGAVRDIDQDYYAELQHTVAEAGLEDVTAFVGGRTDIPDILSAAEIALHASTTPEPFGIVVLEAMALGTAVVAARRGGHIEFLVQEVGLVHDVEHPEQLADHLTKLVADPALRRTLAERAARRAAEFTIDKTARKTEAIYARMLSDS